MRIREKHIVQARGQLVIVELDGPEPKYGSMLRRISDGQTWPLRGVEWLAIPRRPGKGDQVGLLLPLTPSIMAGDEIERI